MKRPVRAFLFAVTLLSAAMRPNTGAARQQGPVERSPIGVSGYLLTGVYDNLSTPGVPGKGLVAGVGMLRRGVYPPGDLPGYSQRVQLQQGNRTISFQTLYGQTPVQGPTALTFEDYLARVRREQARRMLVGNFLASGGAEGETRRSGNLLQFEIPINVPRGLQSVVGQGGAGLTISGNRRIRFSGRSEWTEGSVSTATAYQTKFPTLNMEQDSQFRITGSIGDKIEVSVDQDSRALTDLENNINISYRGYEDEVLQELVAGNTDFSLPGSQFLGFNQNAKGLFGIKARAQLGDLHLTALATQEKGSGEKATFRAGAKENTIRRPDIEPMLGTYYFLDTVYRDRFSDRVASPLDSITAISVFIDDQKYENDVEDSARPNSLAFFDLDDPQPEGSRETHIGSFHELDPEEYYVNRGLGVLALNVSLGPKDVLGVVYSTAGGQQFGQLPGTAGLTLEMKLIKPSDPRPEDPTWDYELRNVYYLGSRNIPAEGFKLKIFYNPPSGEDQYTLDGRDYLNILGLDQWGELPGTPPDGNIDLNVNYVNLARGELIFPDLEPFKNPDLGTVGLVDMYATIDRSQLNRESKYYMQISTATRAATYTLPAQNILDGSEVVTLNGRRLSRGSEYQINYLTGEVNFLTDAIQDPTADVTIDYEYSPLISLEQKVLMGLRSEYDLGEVGNIAAMLVSRSERTIDQRIRLGREPNRNMIWDATAQLQWRPEWITRAMDALPGVSTDAPSRLQFEAEVARSDPDPNTEGDALVDDFEGSKDATGFGIGRGRWFLSSPPEGRTNDQRARMAWFNPYNRIPSRQIWPEKETDIRSSQVNVLTLALLPQRPNPYPAGAYQWGSVPLAERWNGIQQAVSAGAADISRLSFIELWVNGNAGQLHVDLGSLSEDVIQNGNLDTEDQLINGVRNGVVDAGEDRGLDGKVGAEEFDYYLFRAGQTPAVVAGMTADEKATLFASLYSHPIWYSDLQARLQDPSLDDFRYAASSDYSRINGTEDNSRDPDRLGKPDTEDLNGNGYLDRPRNYFSYTVDLSPDSADSVYVAGGVRDPAQWDDQYQKWRLYRIPLTDFSDVVGSPDLSLVEAVRIWVDGAPDSTQTTLSIASFDVVGNQWRESPVLESGTELPPETLQISVRNTFDNPEYEPPPQVRLVRDPVTNLTTQEQSLALTIKQLPPGVEAEAFTPRTRPEDFTQYQGLGLYLYGLPAGPWVASADTSNMEAFLRFGADGNNYYEYHTKVYPGWDDRNQIEVDFDTITNLKEELLTAWGSRAGIPDTTIGNYRVRGRPSLTNIRRLAVGITNSHPTQPIDGELWVDELRVIDVRRDPGTASRVAIHTELADVASLDFRMTRQTADFHGLRTKRGTLSTTTVSSLAVRSALDRFLPAAWGLAMPLNVNIRRNMSLPKYQPGSDRILPGSEQFGNRTQVSDESLSLSLRKTSQSSTPWVAWTLDRMSGTWTGTRRDGVSPVNPVNKAYQVRGSFAYDLNPRRAAAWHPLRPIPLLPSALKESTFNPLPTELRYTLDMTQVGEQVADRTGQLRRRYAFTAVEGFNLAMNPFDPVRSRYTLTLNRDLTSGWRAGDPNLGREVARNQLFDTVWEPRTLAWLTQRYQYVARYGENNDPRFNTQIVTVGDSTTVIDRGRDSNSIVDASANYTLLPSQVLGAPVADEGLTSPQRFMNTVKKMAALLQPLTTTLTQQRNANLFGLAGRPTAPFRLGLTGDPHVARTSSSTTQQSLLRTTRRINLSTRALLPYQIEMDLRPDWQWIEQESQSKNTFTNAIGWPSVGLRWLGLQRLWIFPTISRSMLLSTFYRKTAEHTDWINDAAGGARQPFSSRTTVGHQPLFSLQMTLPNGMAITLARNITDTQLRQFSLGGSQTSSRTSDFQFRLSYNFSAPQGIKIPLFGNLRLQSQLDMSLDISRSDNETKVRTPAETFPNGVVKSWRPYTPTSSQATWSFRPNILYNFSRRVRGGLDLTFQNVNDRLMRRTRKVREVALFVNLFFS